jgi:hypothetical protein
MMMAAVTKCLLANGMRYTLPLGSNVKTEALKGHLTPETENEKQPVELAQADTLEMTTAATATWAVSMR